MPGHAATFVRADRADRPAFPCRYPGCDPNGHARQECCAATSCAVRQTGLLLKLLLVIFSVATTVGNGVAETWKQKATIGGGGFESLRLVNAIYCADLSYDGRRRLLC